ncbi:MAG: SusD/RagB family nutrient-binding outer membrane lipoprotein [Candidatus Azobacteroides sp.]|nr:SusD/RagB family nutrient-binding outer membrane lipoprotein [Candidatus Azobacteroides sp.]
MKKIYKSILFILATLMVGHSCTDGFEDINDNPNRTTSAEPEYIFGLTTVAMLKELSSQNNWYFFGNYTNQWSVIGGSAPHFGFDGRGDRIWNNLYVSALNPLFSIINDKTYAENPSYVNRIAIAKIWRSYVFSQLVGLYGPLPYSDACNGQASIKFDKEEDVYRGILAELKDAYTALDPSGDKYPSEAEPFLGSDIQRWKQFAHCIRLRTAARLTEVPDDWAPGLAQEARQILVEELNNAENNMLISNNNQNFYMTFGEDTDNQNPLYREVIANPELDIIDPGNFPVIHESLIMWMKPTTYNDPCLDYYMEEGSGGTRAKPLPKYLGRPHSMGRPQDYVPEPGWTSPYDALKYDDFAKINKRTFAAMTANFYLFSYPELCFLRAEAVYKGYWSGPKTAEEYYYDGIDARCSKYGASNSAIQEYKDFPGIKWSTPTDTISSSVTPSEFWDYLSIYHCCLGGEEDNFKRIILQHWISLFGQGIDNYTLLRRTEVIPFKPHFEVEQNNGYVDARYGYTPERLVYPSNERNINKTETQYAIDNYLLDNTLKPVLDQVTYRLIFAKDNPGLLYPEYPYNLPNRARNRIAGQ